MRRALLLLLPLAMLAGCARPGPHVAFGAPCSTCSMTITDARFACVRRDDGRWKSYDSIECLLHDGGATGVTAWLSDYDTRRLVPADSLWIVHGDFPTPMGGGWAAFARQGAAAEVAREARGTVARFAEVVAEAPR